ncbi:MAG: ImmA/IrrE family metallo-endopeptidase [Gammaproteobacteria bacterium]|nr:ImmA/IrrE family metallo-endopeptidase [Gammaproteobacteria bacterium]
MRHRLSGIRARAISLLKKNDLFRAPVDVVALAERLGLTVVLEELDDDVSGLLMVKGGKAIIVVNAEHHPNRQRFTAAHELAHYALHNSGADHLFVDRKVFFRDEAAATGEDVQEIEANKFAAELLMPKALLGQALEDENIDLLDDFDVHRLARKFKVSEQALGFRLASLQLIS